MADGKPSEWVQMPGKLARQFQDLTVWDFFVIALLTAMMLVTYREFDLLGLIIAGGIAFMLIDQGEYVRTYDYLFIQLPASLYKRHVQKGWFWRSGKARKSPIRYSLKSLPGTPYALTTTARQDDRVSLTIVGSGSPYMSLNVEGMRRFLSRLEQNYKSLVSDGDLTVTFSSVVRLRDWDPHPYRMFIDGAEQPGYLLPRKLVVPEGTVLTEEDEYEYEQWAYTEELIAEYQKQGARDLVMALVITVKRKPAAAKQAPLYADTVLQAPIIEIAHQVIEKLTMLGVEDATILDINGARQFYHEAWNHDPAVLAAFRSALRDGTLSPGGHWPRKGIHGSTTHVTMDDNNVHGLIRITGTPETVSPLFMQQIYSVPATNPTITELTRTMTAKGELFYYGTLIDLVDGFRAYIGQGRERARAGRKRRIRLEREEFADEQPLRALMDIYIDISAPDLETWEREMKRVLNYLETCTIQAKKVRTLETILHELVWKVLTGEL